MPMDISNPTLGYAAFVGIKFAGYSYFAADHLNSVYKKRVNPWFFGAVRTLVGMTVGGLLYFLLQKSNVDTYSLYAALIPIRLLEWLVVIAPFYDPTLSDKGRLFKQSTFGIVVSFLLDIPAAFIGFISAGVWVC